MIGNIKGTFPPKNGLWEKQVFQNPGYVKDIGDSCCMLHALCRMMSETSVILKPWVYFIIVGDVKDVYEL